MVGAMSVGVMVGMVVGMVVSVGVLVSVELWLLCGAGIVLVAAVTDVDAREYVYALSPKR